MLDLDRLLVRTSRTFALAIPQLPDPPRREVTIAYLLFRIADTFEDAAHWPRAQRLEALQEFMKLVRAPCADGARRLASHWVAARPCDDEGYLELLHETPAVLAEMNGFRPTRREAIIRHTLRTTEGMGGFVARGDEQGRLALASQDDLQQYCYVVAGVVGELLTELFLDVAPSLEAVSSILWANARAFGEGLQLVNILKDANADARDGRVYLPPTLRRDQILALARADLRAATEYVLALQSANAPRGMVGFTALPVVLARAALDSVERFGAGAKISRDEVMALMGQLHRDLDAGTPAIAQAG